MRRIAFWLVLVVLAAAAGALVSLSRGGFSARREPSGVEAYVARRFRLLAIPWSARKVENPLPATPEVIAEARGHYADHCAICHANDGSGDSDIGQNLNPRVPDMRKESTQSLSDGELFYIIRNGIRFTGMPAWGGESVEDDQHSWKLVHFIRHLPELTREEIAEMAKLNPRGLLDLEEERAAEEFLSGEESEPHTHEHHHDR